MRTARLVAAALLALAASAGASAAAPVAAGRYTAELCVATSPGAPNCGPAEVEVRANGSMRMRIDDIAYEIALHSSQVEIVVMHNLVQIDELIAPYEWAGRTLRFDDDARHSRYEIRFPARRAR